MSAAAYILSDAPGATRLDLGDGAPWSVGAVDFGAPRWSHTFAAGRGTMGGRAAAGQMENRQVVVNLYGWGAATTATAMASALSTLAATVDELRRYGGVLMYREHGQPYRQYWRVMAGDLALASWGREIPDRNLVRPSITLTCAPLADGDPMDHEDGFTDPAALTADYTADAGAITNMTAGGGMLTPAANPGTENRLVVTGNGYDLGDTEATLRTSPGTTITSYKAGVVLKRTSANDFLEVYLDDNGTNSRLRVDKVVAGTRTNLATANLATRMATGVTETVRGRIEGPMVYAEHFPFTSSMKGNPSGATTLTVQLTGADLTAFGPDVAGKAGFSWRPQQTAARIYELSVWPFTYRGHDRRPVAPAGVIPGDATALAEAVVSVNGSAHPWGMLAWAPRPSNHSFLLNHGADPWIDPWNANGVTGVTGAASVARSTADALFGEACVLLTTSAANTGAVHPIRRRFRRGVTYTASCWVKAGTGAPVPRLKLGVNGDLATSGTVTPGATWTKLTVTWTPTADRDLAYLAVENTAATAAGTRIDGVLTYEGTVEPVMPGSGLAGEQPFGYLDALAASIVPAETADANADGGTFNRLSASVAAGGLTISTTWTVNPQLLPPDDYGDDQVEVEVWARLLVNAAFTGGMTVSVQADGVPTLEWGEGGRDIPLPLTGEAWRIYRLGTVIFPQGPDWDSASTLAMSINIQPGTNAQRLGIDWLLLTLPRARAATPTAVDDDTAYPDYWAVLSTGTGQRRFQPGGRGFVEGPAGSQAGGSLGGAPLELPTGRFQFLSVASTLIPDAPTLVTGSESTATVSTHWRVTPRWAFLRDTPNTT